MQLTDNYSAITDQITELSERTLKNSTIDKSLYTKYNVKRGLRDLDGKGVLTGLTEISEVQGRIKDENGNEIPKLVASIDFIPSYVEPVYAENSGDLPEDMQDEGDYSNGRTAIFRSYFEQLNMTGHDEMGATLPDGEIAVHAHNIYLQVAYDHGIGVGILFVIFGVASFVCAVVFYMKKKETVACAALPMVVILSFAIAGMVEWIFHLSSPGGLVLMLVLTPLLYKESYEL